MRKRCKFIVFLGMLVSFLTAQLSVAIADKGIPQVHGAMWENEWMPLELDRMVPAGGIVLPAGIENK